MYSIEELHASEHEVYGLTELANRERLAIQRLSGEIYSPHIDNYNIACVKRAVILRDLKSRGLVAISNVEIITDKLKALHQRAKSRQSVELEGEHYECRFAPLKLSKSGKIVRKWAKYWLRKQPDGNIDEQWRREVRKIWPEYFLITVLPI
ncbi:hypothetical protein [Thalassotalea fusca]